MVRFRHKKTSRFITCSISLVLLLIAVLLAWFFFFAGSGTKKSETPTSQQVTSKPSSSSSQMSSESETSESSSSEQTVGALTSLLNGDYSLLSGVWQNDLGDMLVFTEQVLLDGQFRIDQLSGLSDGQIKEGTNYEAQLLTSEGNTFNFVFVQANEVFSQGVFAEGYSDISDNSRDRILVGNLPISDEQFVNAVFYKVSD